MSVTCNNEVPPFEAAAVKNVRGSHRPGKPLAAAPVYTIQVWMLSLDLVGKLVHRLLAPQSESLVHAGPKILFVQCFVVVLVCDRFLMLRWLATQVRTGRLLLPAYAGHLFVVS